MKRNVSEERLAAVLPDSGLTAPQIFALYPLVPHGLIRDLLQRAASNGRVWFDNATNRWRPIRKPKPEPPRVLRYRVIGLASVHPEFVRIAGEAIVTTFRSSRASFADPIRDALTCIFRAADEALVPQLTRWARDAGDRNVLVQRMAERWVAMNADNVRNHTPAPTLVIADVQTVGEVEWIRAAGGCTVVIQRPFEPRYQPLSAGYVDHLIVHDGTSKQLQANVLLAITMPFPTTDDPVGPSAYP